MKKTALVLSFGLIALSGCNTFYDPTPTPDYTVHVVPTATGMVAVPPDCPPWSSATVNPYDNQPIPQFGCANARNLSLMVDRPSDLVKGRNLGDSKRRYGRRRDAPLRKQPDPWPDRYGHFAGYGDGRHDGTLCQLVHDGRCDRRRFFGRRQFIVILLVLVIGFGCCSSSLIGGALRL